MTARLGLGMGSEGSFAAMDGVVPWTVTCLGPGGASASERGC